jgi:RNA polymerase sigma-70 factor (sigma-E family)
VSAKGVSDRRTREFVEFYETNKDACLRAVAVTVPDRHLAEELVSEAFTRAWCDWGKVGEHASPPAWVVRVALNTRVSWWRRRRREVALAGHDIASADDIALGLDDDVIAALRRLPVRQREVIALRLMLDLDTATTAAALGIAPGTVTAHLARAMSTLRECLPSPTDSHPIEVTP